MQNRDGEVGRDKKREAGFEGVKEGVREKETGRNRRWEKDREREKER